jgi:ABC-type thiamine transport system ATPase subunit
VRAARVAFEEVNPRFEQIARTLGASEWRVFFTITLPLAARGVVSGMLLAFARAVGEFGATILVAGNIPGRTTTLSVAIYNLVQLGRDEEAFRLLAVAVAIAFIAVWTAETFLRRTNDTRVATSLFPRMLCGDGGPSASSPLLDDVPASPRRGDSHPAHRRSQITHGNKLVATLVIRDLRLPLADFPLEVSAELSARATALYGPSGAGKTSLLEAIAGLRTLERGRIELHGRDVTHLPPRLRRIGYVPQDDALFPHLSARQNIFYGAREQGDDVLDVLELRPVLDRGVKNLSGGERKRVALARALVTKPEILLLDEPLAGVDVALRDRVLQYLVRVRDEFPIPAIYVTHQMAEVEAICEEMVVLERGRVVGQRAVPRSSSGFLGVPRPTGD